MALRLVSSAPAAPALPPLRAAVHTTDEEGGCFTVAVLDGYCTVREAHLSNVTRAQAEAVADLLLTFGA